MLVVVVDVRSNSRFSLRSPDGTSTAALLPAGVPIEAAHAAPVDGLSKPSTGAACAASIGTPAGSSAAVDVPSGDLKLNREFDLTSTTTTNILLDFDGDQSIKAAGNS